MQEKGRVEGGGALPCNACCAAGRESELQKRSSWRVSLFYLSIWKSPTIIEYIFVFFLHNTVAALRPPGTRTARFRTELPSDGLSDITMDW